jgi:hypothetical protein
MSVSAEIPQHMFWAAERPFGVDNPLVTEQYPQPRGEGARFRQRQEESVELECAGAKGGLESGNKLAAKDTAEHFDRQEEGLAGRDPAVAIRSEAASGNYAVDVWMMLQSLIPGVEQTEEAYVGILSVSIWRASMKSSLRRFLTQLVVHCRYCSVPHR